MRICVLIDAWEPIWGGGPEHVWQLSQQLATHYPISIDIYTRKIKSEETSSSSSHSFTNKNIRLFRVGPRTRFFNLYGRLSWLITVVRAVLLQHRQQKYDLIHGHAYFGAIPTKIISMLTGVPCIFTVHGSNHLDLGYKNLSYYIEKFFLTQIVFSQEISVTKHFLSYDNSNKNTKVIPNGVNILVQKSKRLRKNKNSTIFLWVGRFDKIKGVDILLKAFKAAETIKKNISLQLVGYGFEEAVYKKLAKSLELGKTVKFFSKKNRKELRSFYQKADVFILPSYSEGLSLTLLEAMAAKLPVIVTNVGDNRNFVKQGYNGFIIPPGDISALADAILKAARHQSLVELGKNGYNTVKSFTWINTAKQIYKVYTNVLNHDK